MTTNSRNMSWYGQKVDSYDCPLIDLPSTLPEFSRHQFGVNEYLDVIVREPFGDDRREIPVASVSKKYALVQHAKVAQWLMHGVTAAGLVSETITVSVSASEYGERVMFWLQFPDSMFDPGDGHGIQQVLEVTNSVDKTTSLEVRMLWYRLICLNGMYSGVESVLRIIHSKNWMRHANVSQFITEHIDSIPAQIKKFQQWLEIPLDVTKIQAWVDKELSTIWGVQRAARFYSIVTTGFDGELDSITRHLPPASRHITHDWEVPGISAPVTNAYHAIQALSWIASRASSIEAERKLRRELVDLSESLLASI